jgi:hypothetical protein
MGKKKDGVGGYIWNISGMNPLTLVQSWRKLLQDIEDDDLQSFPNEEISKSEILDMVCAMRSLENINVETLKNG